MKIAALFLVMLSCALSGLAQTKLPRSVRSVTLTSMWSEDGHGKLEPSPKAGLNCFDLVAEKEVSCEQRWDILYGNLRVGDEWDWFYVSGSGGVRGRMVSIGTHSWKDKITICAVEPFPKLAEGESRTIKIDNSGKQGQDGQKGSPGGTGAAGKDARGAKNDGAGKSAPRRDELQAVSASAERTDYPDSAATESPMVLAKKGEMHVIRVKDDKNDFYVLMRVDDIVRGRTASISWKQVKGPEKKWKKQ